MDFLSPMVPDFEGDFVDSEGNVENDAWICPRCGESYELEYDAYKHCPNCGQAIVDIDEYLNKIIED